MEEQDRRAYESYRTTGEFSRLGRGYRRHCGPTAITNLLLTLRRQGETQLQDPAAVFRSVASLGTHRLCYGNFDLLGHWGGTSDLLSPLYLRSCLRRFGFPRLKIGPRRRLNAKRLEAAVNSGAVLYLQLRRHPRYGNHHLLCYGAQRDGETGEWRLRVADGWTAAPVELPLRELRRCWCIPIEKKT